VRPFSWCRECKKLQGLSSCRDEAGRDRRHLDGISAIRFEAAPRYQFIARPQAWLRAARDNGAPVIALRIRGSRTQLRPCQHVSRAWR
jgi:hypothetical protein